MVRTVISYEAEVGADGEVGMMNETKDEVVQEAERPGWLYQAGETRNYNTSFQIPDSPRYSGQWLIKVHIRLNRLLVLERHYPLLVRR